MTKDSAIQIRDLALQAVKALSQIATLNQVSDTKEEREKVKKGVGLAIGQIQTEILDVIAVAYPELDDL